MYALQRYVILGHVRTRLLPGVPVKYCKDDVLRLRGAPRPAETGR
jgi:hypothetical protein